MYKREGVSFCCISINNNFSKQWTLTINCTMKCIPTSCRGQEEKSQTRYRSGSRWGLRRWRWRGSRTGLHFGQQRKRARKLCHSRCVRRKSAEVSSFLIKSIRTCRIIKFVVESCLIPMKKIQRTRKASPIRRKMRKKRTTKRTGKRRPRKQIRRKRRASLAVARMWRRIQQRRKNQVLNHTKKFEKHFI